MRLGVKTHSLLIIAALMLGGCLGAPELPLLSDVELADNTPANGLVAADVEAADSVLAELESVENVPEVPPVTAGSEKPRRGLLGFFARRNRPVQDAQADEAIGEVVEETVDANDAVAGIENFLLDTSLLLFNCASQRSQFIPKPMHLINQ